MDQFLNEVELFQQNGWVIVRNIINKKTIEFVSNFLKNKQNTLLDIIFNETGIRENELVNFLNNISKPDLGQYSKTVQDALFGHFDLETRLDGIVRQITTQSELQILLKKVLNSNNLYLHMPPTSRFVLPNNKFAGVPAHQDISYNQHMSDFIVCWVPLVEINELCGGVKIWKNSNIKKNLLDDINYVENKNNSLFWNQGIKTSEFEAFQSKMNPGDILLLNKWIVHESIANNSDYTRLSIDFRLFGDQQSSMKHFFDFQKNVVVTPN